MFDKLFGVLNKIEAEPKKVSESIKTPDHTMLPANQRPGDSNDKGVLIGYDYLKKMDAGNPDRIQQKMALLKQLQDELGEYNE